MSWNLNFFFKQKIKKIIYEIYEYKNHNSILFIINIIKLNKKAHLVE